MTRMPFGLNNSASTFQRTMELVLQGLQWETCLVYIDDIIVFGIDFDQHVQRVDEVLTRIAKAGLKLKPEKCNMLQTEVVFLGHIVSAKGVQPDPANIAKIAGLSRPTTTKEVKQFVATGSYYRRFMKNFAKVARPLHDLTKKDAVFKWDEEHEDAFNKIKEALMGPDIMGHPMNDGGTFYLDTDASGIGIGAVLSQEQGGRERVIAYASRSLSKCERNYCITEQELLAVVYFIQYFRQYLLGRKFVVRSDHQSLVWLFSLKEPNGKIARWIEILAPYDFSIEYRPGVKQGHCDALSRCKSPKDCSCADVDMSEPLKCGPCAKCKRRAELMMLMPKNGKEETDVSELKRNTNETRTKVEETSTLSQMVRATMNSQNVEPTQGTSYLPDCSALTPTDWAWEESPSEVVQRQQNDPDIEPILSSKITGVKPSIEYMTTKSPASRHYWILWDDLFLSNGVLCRKFLKKNGIDSYIQVIAPMEWHKDIVKQMHDSPMSGHLGVKKTKEKLLQRYYWFKLKQDVKLHIKMCDICAADKTPTKTPRAPMGHLKSGGPWDTLAIDYLGPFPKSESGNKYILVMTDHFTKYVELIAVPNQQAEDCASRIMNEVISRWGTPLSIHCDQGTTFGSKVFQDLCRLLQVRKTRTSPRNPRGNGQTERFNRTLLKMIRAYLSGEQRNWDKHLGVIAGAYRATPHESTELTPNLMSIGREVRLPADVIYGSSAVKRDQEVLSVSDHVTQLQDRMRRAQEIARRNLKRKAERSKEVYDTKVVFNNYKLGDQVWYLHETRKVGQTPKLEKRYSGPFVIIEKRSHINFIIQLSKDGNQRLVHHNKLKPYEGIHPPKWASDLSKNLKN